MVSVESKNINIERLTRRKLRPFGIVIDSWRVKDSGSKNAFGILLKERARGWRIGYLIVRERTIRRLERHPDSFETFEPVKGRAVIALAPAKNPQKNRMFLLDKPIVVKKNVWHDVAALSKKAEIKIFENIAVKTEYQELNQGIRV